MTTETALPTGDTAEAGEQSNTDAAVVEQNEQQTGESVEGKEGEAGEKQPEAKKEKTPEQREIERLRRRVGNLTRQKYEAQARQPAEQRQQGTQDSDDGESVTLTRAELQRQIAEQAQRLAPSISDQRAETERRQGIVKALEKQWGTEEFDAKALDLDTAFGGLKDAQGRPKPATDAIFDADNPKALIEYLTDPDNADEAERIAHLPALRAGREIARLEQKLKEEAGKAKPKPSKAPVPLEAVKGGGMPSGMPDPSNTKAYIAWANAQERAERA